MSSSNLEDSVLRQVRRALGLTQLEAASILNITQSGVSHAESRGDVSIASVVKLVEAKGLRASIVIGQGKDPIFVPLTKL